MVLCEFVSFGDCFVGDGELIEFMLDTLVYGYSAIIVKLIEAQMMKSTFDLDILVL